MSNQDERADKRKMTGSISPGMSDSASTLLCVSIFLICVLCTRPFVEVGLGDDFSYVWTAAHIAETGRIVYTGWSSPSLGYLAYFVAFFVRLFHSPFVASHVALLIISVLNTALLQRVLLRIGVNRFNAVVATCSIMLSPICFPFAIAFLTDIPGMFALLVPLYCCVRAMQIADSRRIIAWLAVAYASNLLLGSVRQISFLGALVMVPSAALCLRGRRGVVAAATCMWCVSAAAIAIFLAWFARQPYSLPEPLVFHYNRYSVRQAIYIFVCLGVALLPMLSNFLYPSLSRYRRKAYIVAALVAAAAVGALVLLGGNNMDGIFSDMAAASIRVSRPVEILLLWVLAICLTLTVTALPSIWRKAQDQPSNVVSFRDLCKLLIPMSAVYMLMLVTRLSFLTRYIGPILMVLTLILCKVHVEWTGNARFRVAFPAITVCIALFAVALTHDMFREQVARKQLEGWYVEQGLPRQELEASMALDGWYELSSGGHINEHRIRVPRNAFHPRDLTPEMRSCHAGFLAFTPSIKADYAVAGYMNNCYVPGPLSSVAYRAWIPPYSRAVSIYRYASPYQMIANGAGTSGSSN